MKDRICRVFRSFSLTTAPSTIFSSPSTTVPCTTRNPASSRFAFLSLCARSTAADARISAAARPDWNQRGIWPPLFGLRHQHKSYVHAVFAGNCGFLFFGMEPLERCSNNVSRLHRRNAEREFAPRRGRRFQLLSLGRRVLERQRHFRLGKRLAGFAEHRSGHQRELLLPWIIPLIYSRQHHREQT